MTYSEYKAGNPNLSDRDCRTMYKIWCNGRGIEPTGLGIGGGAPVARYYVSPDPAGGYRIMDSTTNTSVGYSTSEERAQERAKHASEVAARRQQRATA